MANLYELEYNDEYANKVAEEFADLVEQPIENQEDMNSGLKTPDDLVKCLERAGGQSPEAYAKFFSIGRQDN